MAPSTQHDGLLDLLCSHIVSLSWLDVLISPESGRPSAAAADYKPEAFAVSAFVIAVRDIWFLVTAGHVLHDLDQRLEKYGRRIENSHLIDGLAFGPDLPAIPFPLGSVWKYYINSDDGNDYGLIRLSPLFEEQLRAGGTRALTEEEWTDIPKTVDSYCLVGFPKQGRHIHVSEWGSWGNIAINLLVPLLELEPVSTPPESLLRGATDRFYAKVLLGEGTVGGKTIALTDIDGMSGGPIFAIKELGDGRFRYWVIAVQSSWNAGSEVLAGCLIRPLVNGIEAVCDQYEADLKSLQDADKSQDAGGEDRQAPR